MGLRVFEYTRNPSKLIKKLVSTSGKIIVIIKSLYRAYKI